MGWKPSYTQLILVAIMAIFLPVINMGRYQTAQFDSISEHMKKSFSGKSEISAAQFEKEFNNKIQEAREDFKTFLFWSFIIIMIYGAAMLWLITRVVVAINSAIKSLREEIGRGNLDKRGHIRTLTTDFETIMNNINSLVDTFVIPIKETMKVIKRTAEKDLRARVHGEYLGELREFKDDINQANNNLSESIRDVAGVSGKIEAVSKSILESSGILSGGAAGQSSAIDEIACSVNEISQKTNENAQAAENALKLSNKASSNSANGNNTMNQMTRAMEDINKAASSISTIIKVIDGIAFQTNLLALNAAVEAARAGAQGKGFAVVADEVRNLAVRSAKAAGETTALIEDSMKKVQTGIKTANETKVTLHEIDANIKDMTSLLSDITKATRNQAEGMVHINTALQKVSSITTQNASTADSTARMASELEKFSKHLESLVSGFITGN
ncbi:MAG: hypothetical protein HQK54_00560 [Oligoflexales bacterium]|nr:hypothetical protein [Oligoflexales bacterium]